MTKMVRFGVSRRAELLKSLDALLEKIGYGSRSEAIRDLVRSRLVEEEWEEASRKRRGTLCHCRDGYSQAVSASVFELLLGCRRQKYLSIEKKVDNGPQMC